jgi:hypothetical protein
LWKLSRAAAVALQGALEEALEGVEEALVDLEAAAVDLEEVVEDLEAVAVDLEASAVDLEASAVDLDTVVEDLVVFILAVFTEAMALEAVHSWDVDSALEHLLACIRGCYLDRTTTITTITIITERCYLKHNYANRLGNSLGQTDFMLFKTQLYF